METHAQGKHAHNITNSIVKIVKQTSFHGTHQPGHRDITLAIITDNINTRMYLKELDLPGIRTSNTIFFPPERLSQFTVNKSQECHKYTHII